MRKILVAYLSFAALSTVAYADVPTAPQPPSADQLNRVLQSVIAQREQGLNAAALCQGDESALQQQLAAAQAKIDDLTKQLADAKAPRH